MSVRTSYPVEMDLNHPRRLTAFRGLKRLVGVYLGISVLTYVAIVLLRHQASIVNAAVWIRGTIVVASALVMFAITSARPAAPAAHIVGCGSSRLSWWWPSRLSWRSRAHFRCG